MSYSLQGFFAVIGNNLSGKHNAINRNENIFCSQFFVGIYIAETAEASLRRMLSPFNTVFTCFGYLICYTTTAFLPWRTCNLILGSLLTLPAAFTLFLIPETPHWLVRKSKLDKARYWICSLQLRCC